MPRIDKPMLVGMPRTGPSDPIAYYRTPLVGWLFRERINRGLSLLGSRRFERALEVGYGAGAVQLALAPAVGRLHGIDLDADPDAIAGNLSSRGVQSDLRRGDVRELPYPNESFDLVVSFSVFEHLHEYRRALAEVTRVLAPSGCLLLGMPAVNRMMSLGFSAIGFRNIEHWHVTTPADVAASFHSAGLVLRGAAHLDLPRSPPLGLRLYHNWLLGKVGQEPAGRGATKQS